MLEGKGVDRDRDSGNCELMSAYMVARASEIRGRRVNECIWVPVGALKIDGSEGE